MSSKYVRDTCTFMHCSCTTAVHECACCNAVHYNWHNLRRNFMLQDSAVVLGQMAKDIDTKVFIALPPMSENNSRNFC